MLHRFVIQHGVDVGGFGGRSAAYSHLYLLSERVRRFRGDRLLRTHYSHYLCPVRSRIFCFGIWVSLFSLFVYLLHLVAYDVDNPV